MQFSKLNRLAVVVAVTSLVVAMPALGAVLVPGSVLIPAASEPDPTAGAVVASTGPVPFSVPGAYSGTLTTTVISGDPSNILGGLTFTYLLTHDGVAGPNSIGRLTVTDFIGFATDASYKPVPGVAPASIDRNVSADVVGFNFVPTPIDPLAGFLVPGSSSALLVVQTDAPMFADSTAFVIDGGVTGVPSLGPVVPEPATLACFAVAAVGLIRRRRA